MTLFPDYPFLDPDGIWAETSGPPPEGAPRPALFLDRDGVLVEEVNYLHRAEDVRIIDGAIEVIAAANRLQFPVVIVTNQAGIGRRYYDWPGFIEVQDRLALEFTDAGVHVEGIFACPFHVDGRPPYHHPNHPDRKPNPGMLLRAANALNINLAGSWLIGDRAIDVRAARNAHCAGALHVRTGHGKRRHEREAATVLATEDFEVKVGDSIADALTTLPLLAG